MTKPPKRAPIAAIISGAEYQIAIALLEALEAILIKQNRVVDIELEVREVGVLDDIVVRYAHKSPRMLQVKHAMAGSSTCGTSYLTNTSRSASSILQRIQGSFQDLTAEQANSPAMELVTDRPLDANDPMMGARDQITALLTPDAMEGGASSDLGLQRAVWLAHLGCTEPELRDMLDHLKILTDTLGVKVHRDITRVAAALGFNADDAAFNRGMDYVRAWIQHRDRRRTVEQLATDLREAFGRSDQRTLIVVNAIDRHPETAADAWNLDWVDRFDGRDADERRTLTDPQGWEHTVRADLRDLRDRLRAAGHSDVVVATMARQAVIFLVGFYLRRTAGFETTFSQHGQLWSSADASTEDATVAVTVHELGEGDESAIVIAVSQDITKDVTAYTSRISNAIGKVVVLSEAAGAGQLAITTPRHGAALARELVEQTRDHLRGSDATRLHLFFAGPGALAGLVGHWWNALPPTVVYEHLGGAQYVPTLEVRS